jgi:hypothetical protein
VAGHIPIKISGKKNGFHIYIPFNSVLLETKSYLKKTIDSILNKQHATIIGHIVIWSSNVIFELHFDK